MSDLEPEAIEMMEARVQIPVDIWRQVRARAAIQGVPVQKLVATLCREYLERTDDLPSTSSIPSSAR